MEILHKFWYNNSSIYLVYCVFWGILVNNVNLIPGKGATPKPIECRLQKNTSK